jgi:hypothetical protein
MSAKSLFTFQRGRNWASFDKMNIIQSMVHLCLMA